MFPCAFRASCQHFGDDDPRVVVAEYARVLLVSGRISADFPHFGVIGGEGRIVEYHSVRGVQQTPARVECGIHHTLVASDARHGAESLRLDEYFALGVLLRANLVAVEIVGT